jgi:hypothetical protein
MKTAMTLAVLLALGSGFAMAAETTPAPVKMTAAEMDKVVAGASGPQYQKRVDYPCTTCTPIGDGIPDRLRDQSCK